MNQLASASVRKTITLLLSRLSDADSISDFIDFFGSIGDKKWMMAVTLGKWSPGEQFKILLDGTVVTVSIYIGAGQFEVKQLFLIHDSLRNEDSSEPPYFSRCLKVQERHTLEIQAVDIPSE